MERGGKIYSPKTRHLVCEVKHRGADASHLLVTDDAISRSKTSGMRWKSLCFYVAWAFMSFPFRVMDKLRKIYVKPKIET